MAIAYIASEIAHGVDGATTAAIDTTGATLLVAVVSDYTSGPGVTVSDSKSNSWQTPLTAYTDAAGFARVKIYYAYNPTSVGSGHTFTSAGTGIYTCIAVAAFSGVKTSANPYNTDVTGQNDFNTTISDPMYPSGSSGGSVTIPAGALAVTGATVPYGNENTTFTLTDGFTLARQYHAQSVTEGGAIGYWINPGSSASKNPGWDPTNNNMAGACTMATFAAAAGDGPITLTPAQTGNALTGQGTSLGFAILMPDEA